MTPRRILIIRPDRLGDVVLTTPLIRAVKRSFPGSFVAVMTNPVSGTLLQNDPHIDLLITDDPNGADAGRAGFWRKVREVRKLKFDTGLMPLPRERHAWMMLLAGIGTRVGVGTKPYQIITGTRTVSRNKYIPLRHEADYVMDLGRKIGVTQDDLTPSLTLTNDERRSARELLLNFGYDLQRPIIGINPSSNKSAPNWTPQRYADLCSALAQDHQLFINIGMPDPAMEAHFAPFREKHLVYTGTDLRELIALCSFLTVLMSASTGTTHIAAALGVPTITLSCPLPACSPQRWGPLGNIPENLLPSEGFCQHRCPGDPKICTVDDITVERAVRSIRSVLLRR